MIPDAFPIGKWTTYIDGTQVKEFVASPVKHHPGQIKGTLGGIGFIGKYADGQVNFFVPAKPGPNFRPAPGLLGWQFTGRLDFGVELDAAYYMTGIASPRVTSSIKLHIPEHPWHATYAVIF
jgi:hypothetical protein